MALDVGGVIGGCGGLEKSLRGSPSLEPLHLPLPSSGWLMRTLRSIVAPSATLVAFYDSKMTGCGGIRSQLICDELVWDKAIFLQQLAHQFKRRLFVPPSLDQHVEDLAFGVDGAPQIDHPAIDFLSSQVDLGRILIRSLAFICPAFCCITLQVLASAR